MRAYKYNGRMIHRTGAYVGVPNEAYHSGLLCHGVSVSSTGLRRVLASPAHFFASHPVLNPEYVEDTDVLNENKALVFGSACHCRAFEPDLFEAQFLCLPENAPKRPSSAQRKAKKPSPETLEAIEFWDKVAASNKSILAPKDLESVMGMAKALAADDMARVLFSDGIPEVTYVAKVARNDATGLWEQCADDADGIWLQARPDYTPLSDARSLLDYKTADNAEPEAWTKKAFHLRYDIQAALAKWVFEMATGQTRPGVAFVVQEKKAPFVVQSAPWGSDDLDAAMQDIHRGLDRLHYGLTYDKWPPYQGEAFNIIKPAYLKKKEIAA